jgi:hypothetical protein
VTGAREGYRTARTELGTALPPHALDAVLAAYRAEGRRLVATARAVDLVARALRGEVFTPQLHDNSPPGDRSGAGNGTPDPESADELSARRNASGGADGTPAERPARDGTEGPAERPGRDGAAKARKAPAAQRPARSGGAARRKARSSDKQAAAS